MLYATPHCRCEKCKMVRAQDRARRRSDKLLLAHLTPAQRSEWLDRGHFTVRTPSGRVFALHNRTVGNIHFLSGRPTRWWRPEAHLCVTIDTWGWIPTADLLLAQKLALESRSGERHLLRIAG